MNIAETDRGRGRIEDLTGEIAAVIRDHLLVDPGSPHEDLLKAGVLDSLTLIQLLVQLEERFNVTIPLMELNIEDLRSIASLARLVADRKTVYALEHAPHARVANT
jgi:acyl carrier protein